MRKEVIVRRLKILFFMKVIIGSLSVIFFDKIIEAMILFAGLATIIWINKIQKQENYELLVAQLHIIKGVYELYARTKYNNKITS